jgi:O-methyltransferase
MTGGHPQSAADKVATTGFQYKVDPAGNPNAMTDKQSLGEPFAQPFDSDSKRNLLERLRDPRRRAAFVDFVAREILPHDHHRVFWGDRMLTLDKSMGFLEDAAFTKAWESVRGAHIYDQYDNRQSIAWRMHTLVWAARQALALPEGDFVECGVFQGDMSFVVYHAAGVAGSGRRMHLFDSFEGIDPARVAKGEYSLSPNLVEISNLHYQRLGLYESVCARFTRMPEVSIHRGFLPGALAGRTPKNIAWLHIDLNAAIPEVETLELLFDRVVPSGAVILDDYGWLVLRAQKDAEDAFFERRGYSVLELPTGQGLVIKRPG